MKKCVILTFGCQMNKHDSEIIGGILKKIGYSIFNTMIDKPDIILLNTCAVRQNAENKIIGRIGEYKHLKKENPNLILGICGCVAQEHGKNLLKKSPHIDLVIGPADIHNIGGIIKNIEIKKEKIAATNSDHRVLDYNTPHLRNDSIHGWVSIISGCNNFCSYCIVPYTRGREISRKPEDILKEIKELVNSGYKEINLLGQNVNSYGNDLNDENINFPNLIKKIIQIDGDFWVRFVTSHPKDLSDELINTMKSSDKICHHLHLAVQSGSTKILKAMNRKYTREHYLNRIKKLTDVIPDICLTTDIIVGFPGETEIDFYDTYSLVETVEYDSSFIFKYSVRPGTKAAELNNFVPENIISKRHKKLLDLQIKISEKNNLKFIDQTQKVLVESISPKDKNFLTARNQYNKIVIFKGDKKLIGKFCNVKIKTAQSWTLFAELEKR
jgi:tRNA-2-methylthio-N6-dimethylallyladenosine synthase